MSRDFGTQSVPALPMASSSISRARVPPAIHTARDTSPFGRAHTPNTSRSHAKRPSTAGAFPARVRVRHSVAEILTTRLPGGAESANAYGQPPPSSAMLRTFEHDAAGRSRTPSPGPQHSTSMGMLETGLRKLMGSGKKKDKDAKERSRERFPQRPVETFNPTASAPSVMTIGPPRRRREHSPSALGRSQLPPPTSAAMAGSPPPFVTTHRAQTPPHGVTSFGMHRAGTPPHTVTSFAPHRTGTPPHNVTSFTPPHTAPSFAGTFHYQLPGAHSHLQSQHATSVPRSADPASHTQSFGQHQQRPDHASHTHAHPPIPRSADPNGSFARHQEQHAPPFPRSADPGSSKLSFSELVRTDPFAVAAQHKQSGAPMPRNGQAPSAISTSSSSSTSKRKDAGKGKAPAFVPGAGPGASTSKTPMPEPPPVAKTAKPVTTPKTAPVPARVKPMGVFSAFAATGPISMPLGGFPTSSTNVHHRQQRSITDNARAQAQLQAESSTVAPVHAHVLRTRGSESSLHDRAHPLAVSRTSSREGIARVAPVPVSVIVDMKPKPLPPVPASPMPSKSERVIEITRGRSSEERPVVGGKGKTPIRSPLPLPSTTSPRPAFALPTHMHAADTLLSPLTGGPQSSVAGPLSSVLGTPLSALGLGENESPLGPPPSLAEGIEVSPGGSKPQPVRPAVKSIWAPDGEEVVGRRRASSLDSPRVRMTPAQTRFYDPPAAFRVPTSAVSPVLEISDAERFKRPMPSPHKRSFTVDMRASAHGLAHPVMMPPLPSRGLSIDTAFGQPKPKPQLAQVPTILRPATPEDGEGDGDDEEVTPLSSAALSPNPSPAVVMNATRTHVPSPIAAALSEESERESAGARVARKGTGTKKRRPTLDHPSQGQDANDAQRTTLQVDGAAAGKKKRPKTRTVTTLWTELWHDVHAGASYSPPPMPDPLPTTDDASAMPTITRQASAPAAPRRNSTLSTLSSAVSLSAFPDVPPVPAIPPHMLPASHPHSHSHSQSHAHALPLSQSNLAHLAPPQSSLPTLDFGSPLSVSFGDSPRSFSGFDTLSSSSGAFLSSPASALSGYGSASPSLSSAAGSPASRGSGKSITETS
ncbi:hypothetical protein EXIGLDRAFT_724416 [Exidia glandulosa HHB12029]|uniref:Uncharacterized protein n=1 Tax=Exidia glandulosa HHB12029 TaxID=1314781 RepID=A0A165EFU9_EXIGL|nr:hypothetical protein EXIGLDRAFT_724416 [Exidia glandulosa HHB12029]